MFKKFVSVLLVFAMMIVWVPAEVVDVFAAEDESSDMATEAVVEIEAVPVEEIQYDNPLEDDQWVEEQDHPETSDEDVAVLMAETYTSGDYTYCFIKSKSCTSQSTVL